MPELEEVCVAIISRSSINWERRHAWYHEVRCQQVSQGNSFLVPDSSICLQPSMSHHILIASLSTFPIHCSTHQFLISVPSVPAPAFCSGNAECPLRSECNTRRLDISRKKTMVKVLIFFVYPLDYDMWAAKKSGLKNDPSAFYRFGFLKI